jgi:hypothetical protein
VDVGLQLLKVLDVYGDDGGGLLVGAKNAFSEVAVMQFCRQYSGVVGIWSGPSTVCEW